MMGMNRNTNALSSTQLSPSFMPGFGFGKRKGGGGDGVKGLKLEHRIGVQAPPQVIWDLIAEVRAWPEWNPLYTRAEGVLSIGAPLELTLALPDQPPRHIEPVVIDWVPLEQLHWRTSVAGGFGAAIRYIEIDQVDENACIVSNGELFQGLLGPTSAKRVQRPLKKGFAAMGEALKAKAEAAWRSAR